MLSAGGLKDISDSCTDEEKAVYANIHKCMESMGLRDA